MNEVRGPLRICAVALLLAVAASPRLALAQAADKPAAEALFDRGLALMRDGKFEEGCQKLEQSQAIERGIGTMLYLGECYEKLGRTASAWALFREASSAARAQGESERAQAGAARAEQLESKLSHVTVQVAAENAVEGFELLRDGLNLPSGLWGLPVPVDPGEHKFMARAPGHATWSYLASVGPDAASLTVAIPPLAPAPIAAPTNATPTPTLTATPAPSDDWTGQRSSGFTTEQTAGLIVGGVGVAALAIGSYFGIRAISKNNDAKDSCQGTACDAAGLSATRSAQNAARLANVFVVGGAVLATTGLVMYLVAPRHEERVAVSVSSDGRAARLTLGGTF